MYSRTKSVNLLLNLLKNSSSLKRSFSVESVKFVYFTNRSEVDYLVSRFRLEHKHQAQSLNPRSVFFNKIDDSFTFKSSKSIMTDCLKALLFLDKIQAKLLIKEYPIFIERTVDEVNKQFGQLIHFGFDKQMIYQCPWSLYFPISLIEERIPLMKEHGFKQFVNSNFLTLLLFPHKTFKRLIKLDCKIGNDGSDSTDISDEFVFENYFDDLNERLKYFTRQLNISSEEFCDMIHDNTYLFTYDLNRLKELTKLLIDSGVEPSSIVNDINVYKHNMETLKERIEICKKSDLPFRTWMVRAPLCTFLTTLNRHNANKIVMKDHSDHIEYLSSKLNCSKNVIMTIEKRYPRILQISPKKMEEVIEFLYKNGYTNNQIIETPKILFHSMKTVEKRTNDLVEINLIPKVLKILTLCNEEYKKCFKVLENSLKNGQNKKIEKTTV